MKMIIRCLIMFLCGAMSATSISAQDEASSLFVRVDYMQVDRGTGSDYLDLELNHWKQVHEARVKSGEIVSWNLYRVRYPSGSNAEYSFVTSQVFDDFEKIDSGGTRRNWRALGKDDAAIDKVLDKTGKARTMVKSEIWRENALINASGPAKFMVVDYVHSPRGQRRNYVDLERDVWQPIHQANLNAGNKLGWGLYSLMFPGGSSQPYNFATVNVFEDFSDIVARQNRVGWEVAHPDKDQAWWGDTYTKTGQAREIVRHELWEIIARVDATTVSADE